MRRSRRASLEDRPRRSLSSRRFSVSVRKLGVVRGSRRRVTDRAGFSATCPVSSAQAKNDRTAALKRCSDAGERAVPLVEITTAGEVSASSSRALVTQSGVRSGWRCKRTALSCRRSRRYALMVFGERPSAASLLPKASTARSNGSGPGSSRSALFAAFVMLAASFLLSLRSGPWQCPWAEAACRSGPSRGPRPGACEAPAWSSRP